jgi:hypothetical protein
MQSINYIKCQGLLQKAIFITILILSSFSCKKFIEVDPPITSVNNENVYASDATAAAVLTGIYTRLSNATFANGGLVSMSLFPSLSADELTLFDPAHSYSNIYRNQLSSTVIGSTGFNYWNEIYPIVFITNSAIEGLNKSTSLTPEVKQQLLGEAKFIRGFCYFYLVNLYGNSSLATSTDWRINSLLPRSPEEQVWQQIFKDIKDAKDLLSSNYLTANILTTTTERLRPTKWAANAMLARSYLYNADWANAETEATIIINNTSIFDTVVLNNTFLKNSKEAIWQLQPLGSGTNSNTGEARLFILPASGPNTQFPVYLSNFLVNSFENADQRKVKWVGKVTPSATTTYYYPFKYKIGAVNTTTQEYSMVLRLAEQYLIRAEARAQQGNITGAQADLNIIRKRAGLNDVTINDKNQLLIAILHERRVELFTEWGHRWFDLKRTGNIDAVMSQITPQKGGTWSNNWKLYPIMLTELQKNPNLVQNSGY